MARKKIEGPTDLRRVQKLVGMRRHAPAVVERAVLTNGPFHHTRFTT